MDCTGLLGAVVGKFVTSVHGATSDFAEGPLALLGEYTWITRLCRIVSVSQDAPKELVDVSKSTIAAARVRELANDEMSVIPDAVRDILNLGVTSR